MIADANAAAAKVETLDGEDVVIGALGGEVAARVEGERVAAEDGGAGAAVCRGWAAKLFVGGEVVVGEGGGGGIVPVAGGIVGAGAEAVAVVEGDDATRGGGGGEAPDGAGGGAAGGLGVHAPEVGGGAGKAGEIEVGGGAGTAVFGRGGGGDGDGGLAGAEVNVIEGCVGGRGPGGGEDGGDVKRAVGGDGGGDLGGDEVGGGREDVDRDGLGRERGGEGVAGDSEVGEAGDGAGRVEAPGLGGAAVGEVGKGKSSGAGAGELLVDRHEGERAVGGAFGGEGIDLVGVGGSGGGDGDVAEGGAAAVVVPIHLHGLEDEIGGRIGGGAPAGGEVEAFAAEDAEDLGLDDRTGDGIVILGHGPVVFSYADLGARVVGRDPRAQSGYHIDLGVDPGFVGPIWIPKGAGALVEVYDSFGGACRAGEGGVVVDGEDIERAAAGGGVAGLELGEEPRVVVVGLGPAPFAGPENLGGGIAVTDHVSVGDGIVADFLLGDVGVAPDIAMDVIPEARFVIEGVEADAAVGRQPPLGNKRVDEAALVGERVGGEVVGVGAVGTEAGIRMERREIDGGVSRVGEAIGGGGGPVIGNGISGGIDDDLANAGVGRAVGFVFGLETVFGLGKGVGAGLGHPADGGHADHDIGLRIEGGLDVAADIGGRGAGGAAGGEIPVFGDVMGIGLVVVAGLHFAAASVEGVVELTDLGGIGDVVGAVNIRADGAPGGLGVDGESDGGVIEDVNRAGGGLLDVVDVLPRGEIVDDAGGNLGLGGGDVGPGESVGRGGVFAEEGGAVVEEDPLDGGGAGGDGGGEGNGGGRGEKLILRRGVEGDGGGRGRGEAGGDGGERRADAEFIHGALGGAAEVEERAAIASGGGAGSGKPGAAERGVARGGGGLVYPDVKDVGVRGGGEGKAADHEDGFGGAEGGQEAWAGGGAIGAVKRGAMAEVNIGVGRAGGGVGGGLGGKGDAVSGGGAALIAEGKNERIAGGRVVGANEAGEPEGGAVGEAGGGGEPLAGGGESTAGVLDGTAGCGVAGEGKARGGDDRRRGGSGAADGEPVAEPAGAAGLANEVGDVGVGEAVVGGLRSGEGGCNDRKPKRG